MMTTRIFLVAALAPALLADVHFEKPGQFFDVQPGKSRLAFPLPVKPGEVYTRATIRFDMHIGKLQPVFNSFVDLIRPGGNFFAMQIRADRSKTLVDKMDHTQYGEVAPWKENTDYRVAIVYDTVSGNLTFDALNADGTKFQHMETPISNRILMDLGRGISVGFGIDKVYDNAYYPPWTWTFANLDVTLTSQTTPFWKTTYVYKSAGDLEIKADIYRTPDKEPRPAILWLHGGALIFGHRGNLQAWQAKRYVDAGYVVIAADYRLAPESKLPQTLEDVRDAYQWLREKGPALFGADAARVAVIGHSAGGYLALMSGFAQSPRPQAIVAFYGYGNITGPWQTQPKPLAPRQKAVGKEEAYATVGSKPLSATTFAHERFKFYAYSRQQGLWPKIVTGIDPAAQPGEFKHYQPLDNVDAKYPPTLLLHGDADDDVPFEQSELMKRALTTNGVRAELIRIDKGPHVFDGNEKDPQTQAAFQNVLEFLKSTIGPR